MAIFSMLIACSQKFMNTHCFCFCIFLCNWALFSRPFFVCWGWMSGRFPELECKAILVAFLSWIADEVHYSLMPVKLDWINGEQPLVLLLLVFCYFLVQFCGLMKERGCYYRFFLVELDEQHLSCLLSFWSVEILLGQHKSCAHL